MKEGRPLDRAFEKALKSPGLSVVAEIKRRSPSAGSIGEILDPSKLASLYAEGGAAAISVLTDRPSFGGSIEDLKAVRESCPLPILRKDFTIDPIQIAEAVDAGASAILIIVAAVFEKTKELVLEAHRMGVEAFVEVTNAEELKIALNAGARIIGVNNRDLKTFKVNTKTALQLKERMPTEIVSVAASGMKNTDDTKRVREAGYDAVLIGQTLVEAADPRDLIAKIRSAL